MSDQHQSTLWPAALDHIVAECAAEMATWHPDIRAAMRRQADHPPPVRDAMREGEAPWPPSLLAAAWAACAALGCRCQGYDEPCVNCRAAARGALWEARTPDTQTSG